MAILDSNDFLNSERQAKEARLADALTSGPVFQGRKNRLPLVWYDQYFVMGANPSGTIESVNALRVGGTQSSLDVVIVAAHANEENIVASEGATFEFELLQSETPNGTFEAYGPSYKIVAPGGGITAMPDQCLARIGVGNTTLPWVKLKVTVTGSVTGGKVDIGLTLNPR